MKFKIGDRIKLRTLESIKSDPGVKIELKDSGCYINGSFINEYMYHMFGKEWKVCRHYEYSNHKKRAYHFEIYDESSSTSWAFNKTWVKSVINEIGIDVDELFSEIDI